METLEARKAKAAILLKSIQKEYENETQKVRSELKAGYEQADSVNMQEIVDEAQWIMCLDWAKKQIIDRDGDMFWAFKRGYEDGNYLFWIDDDDIMMMLSIKRKWIRKLYSTMMMEYGSIYGLAEVDETSIGRLMFTAFDSVIYKRNGTLN